VLQKDGTPATWLVGGDVHERIVGWLIAQPHQIRLRINSLGEPFVSKPYLDSVARLTRADNIEFVEILTNGSFRNEQFDRFAANCSIQKLSLWITYHHEFITPAKLVEAACYARAAGAFVAVNMVLFPDNMGGIEETIALCEQHGIPLSMDAGENYNNAYPGKGVIPILENPTQRALEVVTTYNPLHRLTELSEHPTGRLCAAGNDYFFIAMNGDVFPCRTYSRRRSDTKLGSALDPSFVLSPRAGYQACVSPGRCVCPEDHQHLAEIQGQFTWSKPSFRLPVLRS
jgi:MoaA/NifB/PqqE/SkfB family radical SAM enzyme